MKQAWEQPPSEDKFELYALLAIVIIGIIFMLIW